MPRKIQSKVSKEFVQLALYLYPENKDFIRGKRDQIVNSLTTGTNMLVVVCFLIAIGLSGITLYLFYQHMQLTQNVATTAGQYISDEVRVDDDEGSTYIITYGFTANTVYYEHREFVNKSLYDWVLSGEPLTVTYRQDDPTTATIGEPSLAITLVMGGLTLLFFVIGVAVYLQKQHYNTLAMELSQNAVLIAGKVVSARVEVDDDSGSSKETLWLHITYGFTSPTTQKMITGKAFNIRNQLLSTQLKLGKESGMFAPDDPLLILYTSDKKHAVL